MTQLQQIIKPYPVVEAAMRPIARISSRLALLLLLARNGPAASSRLPRQLEIRTLGRIQLWFLG